MRERERERETKAGRGKKESDTFVSFGGSGEIDRIIKKRKGLVYHHP